MEKRNKKSHEEARGVKETYMFGLYAKREAYEEKISLDQGCTSSCS